MIVLFDVHYYKIILIRCILDFYDKYIFIFSVTNEHINLYQMSCYGVFVG